MSETSDLLLNILPKLLTAVDILYTNNKDQLESPEL